MSNTDQALLFLPVQICILSRVPEALLPSPSQEIRPWVFVLRLVSELSSACPDTAAAPRGPVLAAGLRFPLSPERGRCISRVKGQPESTWC